MAVGALFSTSSAINATLYGGANTAYVLAKKGHLPKAFERKTWFNEPEGLYITAALSMFFAVAFDLNGISSLISFVFLIIYLFVITSHYRLINQAGGNKILIITNFILIFSVFITLVIYQWKNQKDSFFAGFVLLLMAFVFEIFYRTLTKRKFAKRHYRKFSIRLPFL
ncbi:MAG: hypothetical protein Q9M89_04350 [Persephonella sp.]|nr:hypothetical protein [Persephonella sp.]